MTSGTWNDKVSALTLVVQESPLHTRRQFETLLGLASKRSRDNALTALAALKDMLAQGHVLPKDRKLRYFAKQPSLLSAFQGSKTWSPGDELPGGLTKQHLLYWAYEDWLKRSYFEILRLMESWLGDAIENARTRSLDFVFELLKEKPEQEENLLRLLVNKLGDTNNKIASKASHRILRLQAFHPSMKAILASAIQSEILLKPGQNNHAKYYAAITLNQFVLTASDPDTANKLLDIYFGVFVDLLNKSKTETKQGKRSLKPTEGEDKKRKSKPSLPPDDPSNPDKQLEDKLVAQILTGIHRAFPYTSQENTEQLERHIQTLFSITHSSNFGTSLRALTLLHTITSSHTAVINSSNMRDRFMRSLYESLLDPRLISATGKHTMYLNLLYRSLKDESNMARVKAFVKRLLQICAVHEPPFMVSVLYLVNELVHAFPSLKSMATQAEAFFDESDNEEVFHDVPDDDATVDADNAGLHNSSKSDQHSTSLKYRGYDPRKRDPLHANADLATLWDVNPYIQHYHPSVTLFAKSLMPSSSMHKAQKPLRPDPASHSLTHFLDRFAYRNPKPVRDASSGDPKALRGQSLMQPALASSGTTDHFLTSHTGKGETPVSSELFWQKRADQVAPDDVFFHRYFSAVGPSRKAAKDRKSTDQSAGTGAGAEEFDDEIGANEDEIWKALVSSRPGVEEEEEEEDEGDDEVDDAGVDEDFEKAMMNGSDDSDEFGGVELNLESDDEEADDGEAGGTMAELDGDVDGVDHGEVELEDDEDIFGAEENEAEESHSEDEDAKSKRKAKRRKLTSLPTFASVDDYAKMIEDGEADRDNA